MQVQNISIENLIYPHELKKIKQAPCNLYAVGNLEILQNQKVSIIGSRKCTEYGKKMALNFAKRLSQSGYTIVSGLAKGIDSYAHTGAMLGRGKTIAVLPCGFHHIYPPDNQVLYQEIIQNGGLVISEYAEEVEVEKEKLVARNRIVAGLARGILVVEGDYRTGTTITTNIAKQNGVPIFCVPGNLDNKKSYTPNLLIKQGGVLVTSEQDIIEGIQNKGKKTRQREAKIQFEEDIETQYMQKITRPEEKLPYLIYPYIKQKAIDIETLMYQSRLDISQINYELTMLVVEGYIKELPGKQYIRI